MSGNVNGQKAQKIGKSWLDILVIAGSLGLYTAAIFNFWFAVTILIYVIAFLSANIILWTLFHRNGEEKRITGLWWICFIFFAGVVVAGAGFTYKDVVSFLRDFIIFAMVASLPVWAGVRLFVEKKDIYIALPFFLFSIVIYVVACAIRYLVGVIY